jgi:hypothetical protein
MLARCSSLSQSRIEDRLSVDAKLMARSAAPAHQGPALKVKKRHVESVTRLPTKRMATACWDFIVVKRGWLQTAPLLDF